MYKTIAIFLLRASGLDLTTVQVIIVGLQFIASTIILFFSDNHSFPKANF